VIIEFLLALLVFKALPLITKVLLTVYTRENITTQAYPSNHARSKQEIELEQYTNQ
jgi:hypothetical protein